MSVNPLISCNSTFVAKQTRGGCQVALAGALHCTGSFSSTPTHLLQKKTNGRCSCQAALAGALHLSSAPLTNGSRLPSSDSTFLFTLWCPAAT
eukprot:1159313-Pelagomonas_calceolata.AAC.1